MSDTLGKCPMESPKAQQEPASRMAWAWSPETLPGSLGHSRSAPGTTGGGEREKSSVWRKQVWVFIQVGLQLPNPFLGTHLWECSSVHSPTMVSVTCEWDIVRNQDGPILEGGHTVS